MLDEKREASEPVEIEISPEMIEAGVSAYATWCRFADAPLEGKARTWFTKRERERLTEEAMIREVVAAIFGSVSVVRRGVGIVRR